MKKNFLFSLIALCAITANLLLPGLAFSQEDQIIGVEIECGPWGITLGASSFEMAIHTIGNVYMRGFGSVIGGKTYQDGSNTIPGEAYLKVEDYRTEAPGCAEEGVDGWVVLADWAPGYYNFNDGHGHTFSPIDLNLITTNNFDASATGADIDADYSIQGSSLWTQFWFPNDYSGHYDIQSSLKTASDKDLTNYACFVWQNCDGTAYLGYSDITNAYPVEVLMNYNGVSGGDDRYTEVTLYVGLAFYTLVYSTNITASSYPYTTAIEYTMEIRD